jgi:predicted nucleic acid-binding protein
VIFIDTNILLYSTSPDPSLAERRRIAIDLLDAERCALSVQVLNEFVWQATHPRRVDRLTLAHAIALVDAWRRHRIESVDLALFDAGHEIARQTNYSWWDCLVIAAANRAGCDRLMSEDMHHGHVIGGVRIENPFIGLG